MCRLRVGTARHFSWLHGVIAVVLVLNALDGILTLYWIFSGAATEANPLMETLLRLGPVVFIMAKMLLVFLGSMLLWRLRRHAWAVCAVFAAFLAYYYILLYHLSALNVAVVRHLVE